MDVHRLTNVEARDVHARGGDASTRPSVRELEDDGDGVAAVAGETRGFGFDWEGERGVSSRDEADPGALGFLHALVAPPTRGDADPRRSAAEVPLQVAEDELDGTLGAVSAALAPGGRSVPVTRFSSVDDVDATRGAGSERGPGGAGRAPRARTPIAKRSGVRSRTGRAGGGAKVGARR